MADKRDYTKLPGRGRKSGLLVASGVFTLWAAADHVLLVETSRCAEDYKRFFFKDIKAIIIRRTTNAMYVNWTIGSLALIIGCVFGLIATSLPTSDRTAEIVIGSIVAAGFVIAVIINVLRGPSCVCHLRTPVQQEEIPAWTRIKTAKKALARLLPLIENAQGQISVDELNDIGGLIAGYQNISEPLEGSSFGDVPVLPDEPWNQQPQSSEEPPSNGESLSWAPPPLPTQRYETSASLRCGLIVTAALNAAATVWFSLSHGPLAYASVWVALLGLGGAVILWFLRRSSTNSGESALVRLAIWVVWTIIIFAYQYAANVSYSIKHLGRIDSLAMAYTCLHPSVYVFTMGAAAVFSVWALLETAALFGARKTRLPQPPEIPISSTVSID